MPGGQSSIRQVVGRGSALAVVVILLAFVLTTNRWVGWDGGTDLLGSQDVHAYEMIAIAAPSLPSAPVPEQHAQRFPLHYAIGGVADLLGIDHRAVYRVALGGIVAAIIALLHLILVRLHLSTIQYSACMAAFVLSAYSLRRYGIAPAMLGDLLFVAGMGATALGLISKRLWLVVAGLLIAILARQTALLLIPVVAGWVALAPGWRSEGRSRRVVGLGTVVGLPMLGLGVILTVSSSFSASSWPGLWQGTVLAAVAGLPGNVSELAEHLARVAIPLLPVLGLIIATAFMAHRADTARLPFAFWGCAALAAAVVIQPLAFNPEYLAGNQVRLSGLGLLPLVVSLGIALAFTRAEPSRGWAVLAIALLAVGSLHHVYTVTGPPTAPATMLVQLAIAALVASAWFMGLRRVEAVNLR